MILNDQTINDSSARYWCLFCEAQKIQRQIKKLNEGVMMTLPSYNEELGPLAQEQILEMLGQAQKGRFGREFGYVFDGMSKDQAVAVANKTLDVLAHEDNPSLSMAKELGYAYGEMKHVDVNSPLAQAASGKFNLITGEKEGWLPRLVTVLTGRMNDFKNWFAYGTSDVDAIEGMNKIDKLEALLMNGGKHTIELMAIIWLTWQMRGVLFAAGKYAGSLLSVAWKNIKSGKAFARCEFEDNEGKKYSAFFDSKRGGWVLKYNHGWKVFFTLKHFVDEQTSKDFFQTQFFQKFKDQCQKYIEPMLELQKDQTQKLNSDAQKALQTIAGKEQMIKDKMFGGKTLMFENIRKYIG